MKLSLTQENLAKALSTVGRIVGSRSTLPVLANVLLTTDQNRLRLSTTNLEMGINYWIGAKVDSEGSTTVPARLLSEYVTNLPNTNIDLKLEKHALLIKTDKFKSTINGIDPEEFPSIPTLDTDPVLELPAKTFRDAMNQVVLVASHDDARPVLSGIYMYTEDNTLYMVATDSYRLAEKKLKLADASEFSAIIPARTIAELVRVIDDSDKTLTMLLDENQVMFRYGDIELVSRLIDGQFPNYRQLIPDDVQTTVTIATTEFSNIAKVASLFARENAGSVTVSVEDGVMSMRSIATQVGENNSQADAQVDGEDIEVALNGRYIIEALSVIKAPEVTFGLTGKINPCVLRPTDTDDYLHIIMPLRS